ncbi:E3 ubiquitin-protein ligase PDZRN3 [Halotydeus destructor]|nr:E3 ubiquitin-protein ligase PDZRN3 [Halotydeus destructor]
MSSGCKWSILCFPKVRSRSKSSSSRKEKDNNDSPYFQAKIPVPRKSFSDKKRQVERGLTMAKESLCEMGTQTEWSARDIPLPSSSSPSSAAWPRLSSFMPFMGIPPPPPPPPLPEIPNEYDLPADCLREVCTDSGFVHYDRYVLGSSQGQGIPEMADSDSEDEEECDAFEYEEIVFEINTSSEKLGITISCEQSSENANQLATGLCHTDNSQLADKLSGPEVNDHLAQPPSLPFAVYVTKIHPAGLAARNGKLKMADQILEVNGMDVQSVDHAEQLLREASSECVLVVARLNPLHDHAQCKERARGARMARQGQLQQFNGLSWPSPPPPLTGSSSYHVNMVDLSDSDFIVNGRLVRPSSELARDDVMSLLSPTLVDRSHLSQITEEGDTELGTVGRADYGDQGTKDEKDSGLGKMTDGDSSCTQANYTSSTDYEHSLEKVPREAFKSTLANGQSGQDYQSDSLYREMSLLSKEMANIQLECDKLVNKHLDQGGHGGGPLPWTVREELADNFERQAKVYERKEKPRNHRSGSDITRSMNKIVPSPPPTPKHYPKYRQQQQNSSGSEKSSHKSGHKRSKNDLIPDSVQPSAKKESIKQWIRNSLPLSPSHSKPSSASSQPKMAICRPRRMEKANNHKVDSLKQLAHYDGHKDKHMFAGKEDYVYTTEKGTQMSDSASQASCDSSHKYQGSDVGTAVTSYSIRRIDLTNSAYPFHNNGGPVSGITGGQAAKRGDKLNYGEQGHFAAPCSTMYTNKANLEHTIMLQQELLRQSVNSQQRQRNEKYISLSNSNSHQLFSVPNIVSSNSVNYFVNGIPPSPSKSAPMGSTRAVNKATKSFSKSNDITQGQNYCESGPRNSNNSPFHSEWKVRKRPDGSRYITKKIVRNRLLKERALRINQERSGLTTDDDAMSELKTGKYWPRVERKRQLEQSKDRRKKESHQRSVKLDALREHSVDSDCPVRQPVQGQISVRPGSHCHGRNGQFSDQQIVIPNSMKNELLTVTTV